MAKTTDPTVYVKDVFLEDSPEYCKDCVYISVTPNSIIREKLERILAWAKSTGEFKVEIVREFAYVWKEEKEGMEEKK